MQPPGSEAGFLARHWQALIAYMAERRYLILPEFVGAQGIRQVTLLGRIGLLFLEAWRCVFTRPTRWHLYFKQMEFIGNRSLSVVLLTGSAIGAILTLQLVYTLRNFSSENLIGGIVALIMAKEMGPLLAGLMINGRVASAIAAEIGTMRVSEQIDALEAMSVDPVQYLISPRMVAGVVMLPFMTMITNMVAMVASWLVAIPLLGLDSGVYFAKIDDFLDLATLLKGLAKSSLFGLILTFVGAYKGFFTRGGAEGVGKATTNAVVTGSVLILLADYFVGAFLLE